MNPCVIGVFVLLSGSQECIDKQPPMEPLAGPVTVFRGTYSVGPDYDVTTTRVDRSDGTWITQTRTTPRRR